MWLRARSRAELARGVGEQAGTLLELEGVRGVFGLDRKLKKLGLNAEASEDFAGFLPTDSKLAPVVEQLVFLEPPRS